MKHKHAELIKAWADGAEIQIRISNGRNWCDDSSPYWDGNHLEFRIKPEPKPDVIDYACVIKNPMNHSMTKIEWTVKKWANLKLTFDGETGKLKSAEVVE
jgi:hypothetical protein